MKKIKCVIIVILLLSIVFLAGCEEQGTTTESNISNKIELQSDLVKLVYAKLVPKTENEEIKNMNVEYLFKNIAGRTVSLKVNAEFYDEENNLIYTSPSKPFVNILKDYVETEISPFNIISYDGENTNKIDHVKIIAEEYFGT